jgi:hypothetical protein
MPTRKALMKKVRTIFFFRDTGKTYHGSTERGEAVKAASSWKLARLCSRALPRSSGRLPGARAVGPGALSGASAVLSAARSTAVRAHATGTAGRGLRPGRDGTASPHGDRYGPTGS